MTDQPMPQNLWAEECVLGAILMDRSCIGSVRRILEADDFYNPAHQKTYAAMCALEEKREPWDMVGVGEQLERQGQLDEIGGSSMLISWVRKVATTENAEHHARIVKQKAALRRIMQLCFNAAHQCGQDQDEAGLVCSALVEELTKTREGLRRETMVSLRDVLDEVAEEIFDEAKREPPIPTGLHGLDELLSGGLRRGNVLVIDGDTSAGKTALALQIALHNAAFGRSVAWFSYEMGMKEMAERAIAHMAKVRVRGRTKADWLACDEEAAQVTEAIGELHNSSIAIFDDRSLTATALRWFADGVREKHGIDLVVVDYIQKMPGENSRRDTRAGEVSSCMRAICEMVGPRGLNCAAIVLSQISNEARARRSMENRRSLPIPTTHDQKESGDIAGDADYVIGILNETEQVTDKSHAKLWLTKNRHGPRGSVAVDFYATGLRFAESGQERSNVIYSYRDPSSDEIRSMPI